MFFSDPVVPKYFYVHKENVTEEKINPGSQVSFSNSFVFQLFNGNLVNGIKRYCWLHINIKSLKLPHAYLINLYFILNI